MEKSYLKSIADVLPFDDKYILVGKGRKTKKWNLMDSAGKLVSENWFSSISKKTDGSVAAEVKVRGKTASAAFVDVDSFARNAETVWHIPVAVVSLVDTGSIVLEEVRMDGRKYIARAKLYGIDVFIAADGRIYDDLGNEMRLLLNTVDSERLQRAVHSFNKKMHYGTFRPESATYTYQGIYDADFSAWVFYFVEEHMCFNTSAKDTIHRDSCKKWTDSIVVRVFEDKVSEDVMANLKAKFGKNIKRIKENWDGADHWFVQWEFSKKELDSIVDVFASF